MQDERFGEPFVNNAATDSTYMKDIPNTIISPTQDRLAVLWSVLLSLGWVVFLWGIGEKDAFALGINAAVWFSGLFALCLWTLRSKGVGLRAHRFWIAPLWMIIGSFAIYDNPALNTASLLILPVLGAVLFNFASLKEPAKTRWDSVFVSKLAFRAVSPILALWRSAKLHGRAILATERKEHDVIVRILIGGLLFVIIAFTIVIPLLSSADAEFGRALSTAVEWFRAVLSSSFVVKLLFATALSVVIVATLLAWTRPFVHENEDARARVDAIVAGIMLGGLLGLYLLFLFIQARHLWVGSLPMDFRETEQLVKSGFWQLLALTVINIVLVTLTHRKTALPVQRLLVAFASASLLLLASAGQRMALYVTTHGLSYEKFFAAYTVAFCAILLIWLLVRMFGRAHVDIIRFGFTLFLWMFAVLTILPVEQIVLRSNVALSRLEGSRIRLYELTMLSPDVLGLVKRYRDEGNLAEILEFKTWTPERSTPATFPAGTTHPLWDEWIERQERRLEAKTWYEMTFMNLTE